MKLKYPNSFPLICTGIAAIPFLCYYFALMFGELFFGRPSSTWVIGFVWIPFLVFRPALIGLIVGFIIWMVFHWLKISGEIQKKGFYSLLALLILISISSVALGFKEVFEYENYYTPRIATGKDLLQKEQFLVNDKLIEIRSISVNAGKSDANGKLIIIGERGALFAELSGEQRAFVSFDRRVGYTVPVDVEGDGVLEFMNRGGGWQPVSLLDSRGQTLWMYPSEEFSVTKGAADTMAAGDIDKDGMIDFVIGMNGSGGLHVLDAKGKEIWKRDAGNVFSVEILDIDKDGTPEILHSDSGEGIVIRKANGDKIGTIKNTGGGFSLLHQGNSKNESLIVYDDHRLNLTDLKGNVKRIFELHGGGHTPHGTLVYFNGISNPPHYAFVRTIQATGMRPDLTVFDPDGKLVYHEIFHASYLAIASLRQKEKELDGLLIGENSKVWLYNMRIHN
ncbi:MAG: VCBS repeat-containing protein [Nitrospirota bacterium]